MIKTTIYNKLNLNGCECEKCESDELLRKLVAMLTSRERRLC